MSVFLEVVKNLLIFKIFLILFSVNHESIGLNFLFIKGISDASNHQVTEQCIISLRIQLILQGSFGIQNQYLAHYLHGNFSHMPRFFKFWGWYVCFYIYNTKKVCLCIHTIKKVESRRIDAFELWCWRRLLRVPWTARRSNQSILKEISPEYSLEGLILKLKLQYFGHLMRRTDSLEKTLMLGKIEGGRRRGRQKMRWLDGITDSMT